MRFRLKKEVQNRELTGKEKFIAFEWYINDVATIETFYEIAKLLDIDVRELFVPTKK